MRTAVPVRNSGTSRFGPANLGVERRAAARARRRDHVPAPHARRIRQIQRHPAARAGFLQLAAVALQGTHPSRLAAGLDQHAVSSSQAAAGQRAGNDGAYPVQGERPVDRQPRFAKVARRRRLLAHRCQRGAQSIERRRFRDGGWHDRRVGERRAAQPLANRLTRGVEIDGKVRLRQRHDRMPHAQVCEDLRVLLGLRHPAVIRGDDEQREVHRPNARHHVAHEILVTRHIDETQVRVAEA